MHRFYLPPALCRPPLLELTGREAHHARDVLRMKPGDRPPSSTAQAGIPVQRSAIATAIASRWP